MMLLSKPMCVVACLSAMFSGLATANETLATYSAGYRLDSLDWNIAGNLAGTSPNVIAELEWRDMQFLQFKGEFAGTNEEQIYFRGSAAFGYGLDGQNQDSDYATDNRTLEFSRSINGVDGSHTLDFSGGIGRDIPFGVNEAHRFIPLIGASYHTQRMRMVDGNQVVSDLANAQVLDPTIMSVPSLGPFAGLDSSYDTQWAGFWLGGDMIFDMQDKGTAFARLEAHWVDFYAEADWNLRGDLAHPVSFDHEAKGTGLVLELGWRDILLADGWAWGVDLSLQRWQTDPGIIFFYGADPADNGAQRLNAVNWSSSQLNFSLSKEF